MAQALFTATFASASGPYNVFSVLVGTTTTGVTKKTGCVTQSRFFPVNVSLLRLTPTTEVAGKMYVGDSTVKASNKNGTPVQAGDSISYGVDTYPQVCLTDRWFDIDTDAMVIAIEVG